MSWPYVDMAELETRVRRRADLSTSSTNPQFVAQAELQQYIQKSWEKLYNYLVGKYEDYFVKVGDETSFYEYTTSGGGIFAGYKDYNLPSDYFKLIRLDLYEGTFTESEPGTWVRASLGDYLCTLKRISWMQERMYVKPEDQQTPRYYILYGRSDSGLIADVGKPNGIRLVATPDTRYAAELVYVPRPPVIGTADETNDGLSFVAGWDEYVVLDSVIKCRDKRDEDTRVLQDERTDWLNAVEQAIMPRDAGQPGEILAMAERNPFADSEEIAEWYR